MAEYRNDIKEPGAGPTGRGPGGNDDPTHADESGDPLREGRSRGHTVDRDNPAGQTQDPSTAAKTGGEHWESGRQDAMGGPDKDAGGKSS